MLTTDLSLRLDPVYEKFQDTSTKILMPLLMLLQELGLNLPTEIWDLVRYLGPDVPQEELLWQDPIPVVDHELVNELMLKVLNLKF
jgi:catalase-peroxidase